MAEQMADSRNLPVSAQFGRSYGAWVDGGWGMILTGNVQVDARHLGGPNDTTMDANLPEEQVSAAYKDLAQICRRKGTPAIMQINHPGRQSPLGAGKRSIRDKTVAPSAISLDLGSGILSSMITKLVFGTPREMTLADIEDVIQRFTNATRIAAAAGFDGVEIHAAHGYLLAQFMSARSNHRTDGYGGSAAARAKIVVEIINAIRAVVPKTFCIGLKLNSVDHQLPGNLESHSELQDCLEQAAILANAGLDFLEISGGSYENPLMVNGVQRGVAQSERSAARESFFLDFAKAIRAKVPDTILMVTGGFRTRTGMEAAILEGACGLIGIGRPAVLNPSLPENTVLNREIGSEDAKIYARKIKAPWLVKCIAPKSVGAGVETAWYSKQMLSMGS